MNHRKLGVILLLAALTGTLGAAEDAARIIAGRREFRELCRRDPARIADYRENADPEIRRYAWYRLLTDDTPQRGDYLQAALQDKDDSIRLFAVRILATLPDPDQANHKRLAEMARSDASPAVRQVADAASWPFVRHTVLLREDPNWDHEVKSVRRFELPNDRIQFRTDPDRRGHFENWFAAEGSGDGWQPGKLGYWEENGFADYDGVAWYRIRFTMPEKPDCNAVEIHFGAVDESAWVWLNGVYLGSHDEGESGWDKPFALDCRKEIRWGGENVLVVRVLDTRLGGGIWKPIEIEILK